MRVLVRTAERIGAVAIRFDDGADVVQAVGIMLIQRYLVLKNAVQYIAQHAGIELDVHSLAKPGRVRPQGAVLGIGVFDPLAGTIGVLGELGF